MGVLWIKGTVSVKVVEAPETKESKDTSIERAIIIMGPTGAGKSSFIEALSGDTSLGISKDQLEGYTQDVCAYRLHNMVLLDDDDEWPLVIFDTPGFADRKISEMDIVTKVNQYIGSCGVNSSIYAVLYLLPITDIRLSGSRRRVIDTFRAMTGDRGAGQVTVVTTMWNTMYAEETLRKAGARYEELRNGPWKELLAQGGKVTKWVDNTQKKALEVLKTALEDPSDDYYFPLYEYAYRTRFGPKTAFLPNMILDLEGRVDGLRSEEMRLMVEMEQGGLDGEDVLVPVLQENLDDIRPHLARFTEQLAGLCDTADEDDEGSFDVSPEDDENHVNVGVFTRDKMGLRVSVKMKLYAAKRWGLERFGRRKKGGDV